VLALGRCRERERETRISFWFLQISFAQSAAFPEGLCWTAADFIYFLVLCCVCVCVCVCV